MSKSIEDVYTLENLKQYLSEKGIAINEKLELLAKEVLNKKSSSKIISKWFNALINEYNDHADLIAEKRTRDFINLHHDYSKILYETFDFFIPFLSTYEKMIALIDLCSLVDDEDELNAELHLTYFEKSVHTATEYAEQINFKAISNDNDNDLLFLLGYFNFRIQNYDIAIEYLTICVNRQSKHLDEDCEIKKYVNSVIFLAESHEYIKENGNSIDKALVNLIGKNGNQLMQHVLSKYEEILKFLFENYSHIYDDRYNKRIIKSLFELLYNNQDEQPLVYNVFNLDDGIESLKTYVHVTAHCVSEFAAMCMKKTAVQTQDTQKIENEIKGYSLLQQISKFLIDWLVANDNAYVTCQATIRAENDACPEAIDLLLKRLHLFSKKDMDQLSYNEKIEKAELEFYIFYFAEQELGLHENKENLVKVFEHSGNEFYKFVVETHDTNALFHYLVIKFKYLLKKGVKDLLERNPNPDYTELDEVYHKIIQCQKDPLPHVFKSLIDESMRLINCYLFFREYRYLYTSDQDNDIINEFNNRLEIRQIASTTSVDRGEPSTDVENLMDLSIVDELIKELELKKSILILAPVKQAPSCSSDYSPINHLCLIENRKRPLLFSQEEETIFDRLNDISAEYGQRKSRQMYVICDDFSKIKWVIYYYPSMNALFLFYGDQECSSNGEMFRAILNDNEKIQLEGLLKTLKNELFEPGGKTKVKNIHCSTEVHTKLHGEAGACNAKLIQGDYVLSNTKLLELLNFAEFEYFSSSKMKRIDEKDYIMFTTIKEELNISYELVCFSSLPNDSKEGICKFCACSKKKSVAETIYLDDTHFDNEDGTNDIICTYQSNSLDIRKIRNDVFDKYKELYSNYPDGSVRDEYSILSKYIDEHCLNGICPYNNNGNICEEVILSLEEMGIPLPFLDFKME